MPFKTLFLAGMGGFIILSAESAADWPIHVGADARKMQQKRQETMAAVTAALKNKDLTIHWLKKDSGDENPLLSIRHGENILFSLSKKDIAYILQPAAEGGGNLLHYIIRETNGAPGLQAKFHQMLAEFSLREESFFFENGLPHRLLREALQARDDDGLTPKELAVLQEHPLADALLKYERKYNNYMESNAKEALRTGVTGGLLLLMAGAALYSTDQQIAGETPVLSSMPLISSALAAASFAGGCYSFFKKRTKKIEDGGLPPVH